MTTNDKATEAAGEAAWLGAHAANPACVFCEGRGSHPTPGSRWVTLCTCRVGLTFVRGDGAPLDPLNGGHSPTPGAECPVGCAVCSAVEERARKRPIYETAGRRSIVGAVELRDNFLDGGYFVRCRGCSLPARVTDDTGNCPHCGWAYAGAQRCTREEYRASRADDAVLPPRPR